MKRMVVLVGVLGIVCAATVGAQAQEAKPGPELKKLDIWLGDWTWESEGTNSKSGEEWKAKGTGQFSRMGEYFYVWRSKWEGGSYINIMGYDPVKKAYFAEVFGSDGWRGTGTVTFGDKTVTDDLTGVSATGEETRERCTSDLAVPKVTTTCETLTDGKWTASSKSAQTKVK